MARRRKPSTRIDIKGLTDRTLPTDLGKTGYGKPISPMAPTLPHNRLYLLSKQEWREQQDSAMEADNGRSQCQRIGSHSRCGCGDDQNVREIPTYY